LPALSKDLKSKDYIIEFTKLIKGANEFTFVIDAKFLSLFEGEHPLHADVKVNMQLVKTEMMHNLHFDFAGHAALECDVCLDEFLMPIKNNFHLIMRISEMENYSDDEIIYITPKLLEFDLTQYLFDSFMLSLPIKKTCNLGNKECNAEVLRKLEEMRATDNTEKEENVDPRWDKLKGIFNN
jgi:uncharacterized metal-binding protein YceD (DUF177 family)